MHTHLPPILRYPYLVQKQDVADGIGNGHRGLGAGHLDAPSMEPVEVDLITEEIQEVSVVMVDCP